MDKYVAIGLPWTGSIGKDVSDCKTAQEVIEKAHLDFEVAKCRIAAEMPYDARMYDTVDRQSGDFVKDDVLFKDVRSWFATYRTDKNVPLGIVKQKYEIVQNKDAFNFFDDAIGPDKAIWQTAGLFGHGHRIFISAKLPWTTDINNEPIDHYLVFSNSHDGSSSVNIMFTPIRVFCFNCLNAARRSADAFISIRHTVTAQNKLNQGAEVLSIASKYVTEAKQLYESLLTVKMTDTQVMEYLTNLVLDNEEKHKMQELDMGIFNRLISGNVQELKDLGVSSQKTNKITQMYDYYQNGVAQQSIAGTAWGAYNAVTGYYSNIVNSNEEKRMKNLLYGSGQTNSQKALNEALVLV